MTSIAGLMTWFGINFTYWRFYQGMKTQGFDRSKLPFTSNLQPFAAWYAMIWILTVCFVSVDDSRLVNHVPSVRFPFFSSLGIRCF